MNLSIKSQSFKASMVLLVASLIVLALFSARDTSISMDVVDILNRAGIIAPSWIVTAITLTGSVLAIIGLLGTLGAGLPASVLTQLAAASTAAA